MKREVLISTLVVALGFALIAICADAFDYPHYGINNIGCDSCHFVYSTQPSLLPEWTAHAPQDIDDTQYNTLCWSCHNDIDAPYMRTHSSLQTDSGYGGWTIECKVCHNPHFQKQFRTYGSASYLYSGASTDVTTNTITKTAAGWTVNAYQGMMIVPNISQVKYNYEILSNTSDTLTVQGPINLGKATAGNTFAIVYGNLINDAIDLGGIAILPPKTGSKTTRFFRYTGDNSFADGDAIYDGVCEVCHTETTHFRNNGTGPDQLHTNMGSAIAGANCVTCHPHTKGFRPEGGCDYCHGYPPLTNTGGADGLVNNPSATGSTTEGAHFPHLNALAERFTCSVCHYGGMPGTSIMGNNRIQIGFNIFGTGGGSYKGQSLLPPYSYELTNGTTAGAGDNLTCSNIYCHSNVQGADGSVTPAYSSPVWNGTVVCGDCHSATMTSGSHTKHTAIRDCSNCHFDAGEGTTKHVDNNIDINFLDINPDFESSVPEYSQSPSNPPGNGYGSCSDLYCHSSVQGEGGTNLRIFSSPTWGESVVCGDCHSATMTSGSHTKHTALFTCSRCHSNAGDGTSKHADTMIDVSFSGVGDSALYSQGTSWPGNSYGSCRNVYCHSNIYGSSGDTGYSDDPYPVWGNVDSVQCGSCHNSDGSSGNGSLMGSATHSRHLGGNGASDYRSAFKAFTCSECHNEKGADTAFHSDGNVDVSFANGGSYSGTPGWGDAYGACSNVYCHSNVQGADGVSGPTAYGNPTWGYAPSLFCEGCHRMGTTGYPHSGIAAGDSSIVAINSGSHPAHIDYGYGLPSTSSVRRCVLCHKWKPDSDPYNQDCSLACHDANTGLHANKIVDVSLYEGTYTGGSTAPGNGFSNCSNTYCHSNGTGGTLNVNPSTDLPAPLNDSRATALGASPSWGAQGPLACNSCHGNTTYSNWWKAAPLYAQDSPKANSHNKHVLDLGLGCRACHYSTTQDNISISDNQKHVNRVYDVTPDPSLELYGVPKTPFTYTYDPGGGRCSFSEGGCHGTATVTWGGQYPNINTNISYLTGPADYEIRFFSDPAGGVAPYTYLWDLGDGTTSAEANPDHLYSESGTYTVSLTVRDANYNLDANTVSATAIYIDRPPTAAGCGTGSINWDPNAWTASCTDASTDDLGVTTVRVEWGDGTFTLGGQGDTFTRTYLNAGTLTITHRANDTGGLSNEENTSVSPAYFTISGIVSQSDGTTPVAGATVKAKKSGSSIVKTVYTNSSGVFTVTNLTPATWNIEVTKTGYDFGAAPQSSVTVGPAVSGIVIDAVPQSSAPTVTAPTATGIGSATATLGANVTSDGGAAITARGTVWGTSADPTGNVLAEGGATTGVFTHARTGLTAGTKIYYRGYATNSAGTGYSPDGSFYTEPSGQASNVTFTSIASNSMTVNWTRGTGDGVIVLMKQDSAVSSNPADGTYTGYTANAAFGSGTQIGTGNYVVYKGTGTGVNITGLAPGTTYYAAVYESKGIVDTSGADQGTNYLLSPATGSQASSAPSGTPYSYTFNYTGSVQYLTIPAGATDIQFTVKGAGGGGGRVDGENNQESGQNGHSVIMSYATSGIMLRIYVGGGGPAGSTEASGSGGGWGYHFGGSGGDGEDYTPESDDWAYGGAGGGGSSAILLDSNGTVLNEASGGAGGRSSDWDGTGGCDPGYCENYAVGGSGGIGGGSDFPGTTSSTGGGTGGAGGAAPSPGGNGQVVITYNL